MENLMKKPFAQVTDTERDMLVMIMNLNYCFGQIDSMCDVESRSKKEIQSELRSLRDRAVNAPKEFFKEMICDDDFEGFGDETAQSVNEVIEWLNA